MAVAGLPSPFVRSLLSERAKWRADFIGLLMQLFSRGRFLPAYWERYDLPDLRREFHELELSTGVKSLQGLLTDEELECFRHEVSEAATAWMVWREKAIVAGVLESLRQTDRRAKDTAWIKWVDDNRALKQEWDDLTDALDELRRRLEMTGALVDARKAEQGSGWLGERGEKVGPSPDGIPGEARALAVLVEHPEWSDLRIAKEAGVNRTQLYRYPRYRAARQTVREAGRGAMPKGWKTAAGDLDAYE